MSWSVSIPAVKPEELDKTLDATAIPSHCPQEDWGAFRDAVQVLARRHADEPYIKVSGHGHSPGGGSYPRRSIGVTVNGTDNAG